MKRSLSPTRRAVLRAAAGIPLALPLLPTRGSAAEAGKYPRRLIVFYVAEGCQPDYWWPTAGASPSEFTFGYSLKPLEPLGAHVTVLKGFAGTDGSHQEGMQDLLTSGGRKTPVRTANGMTFPSGMSIDQVLASHLQGTAAVRSYQLGVQVTQQYGGKIAFDGATGRFPQNNPVKAFDDLLAGAAVPLSTTDSESRRKRLLGRRSLLDSILPELQALRCKVGADGREKLDAHVQGVRTIEQQIDRVLAAPTASAQMPVTIDRTFAKEEVWNSNSKYPAVGRIQTDTLVAALAADVTRVAALQWGATGIELRPTWVPGITYKDAGWHKLSHFGDGSLDVVAASRDKGNLYRWHTEQLVYLIERLRSVPEGAGTLFDNTLILYCSEMSNGNHSPFDLPFMLIGKGGGKFRNGLFMREAMPGGAKGAGIFRSSGDLFAAIAQGFGLDLAAFGSDDRGTSQYSKGAYTQILG